MRAIYPSSASEYSIADIVRGSSELAPGVRVRANACDAEFQQMPALSGTLLANEVQPGLFATGHDATYSQDNHIEIEVPRSLACSILLAGACDPVHVAGHAPVQQELGRPLLIGFGKPVRSHSLWRARQSSRVSGFALRSAFFDRFGDNIRDDGLAQLRTLLDGEFQSIVLPRSPHLTELARRNLFHPYGDTLGELFLESNTLAYVIEVANCLKEARRISDRIGRRHYDRVMHAKETIDNNLASPPKSLDLAREVGVNLTTLQTHFKAAFGVSIFGYIREQRLDLARTLLRDSRLSVAEIGYHVGFSNPAAFTAAYRRHFGQPPTLEAGRR